MLPEISHLSPRAAIDNLNIQNNTQGLKNGHLFAILKIELDKINPESQIQSLANKINEYVFWRNCGWKSVGVYALNMVPALVGLSFFASHFWSYPSTVMETRECDYPYPHCVSHNLTHCYPRTDYPLKTDGHPNFDCQTGYSYISSTTTTAIDFGIVLFNVVGTFLTAPLLTYLETKVIEKILIGNLSRKNENTVSKIISLISQIQPSINTELDILRLGSQLVDIDLSENSRIAVIKKTNFEQLFRFKRLIGQEKFKLFTKNTLSHTYSLVLAFFDQWKFMSNKEKIAALHQIKIFIKNDPIIWKELIEIVHFDQSIAQALLQIGKEIGILPKSAEIKDIRPMVLVKIETDKKQIVFQKNVHLKSLTKVEIFKKELEQSSMKQEMIIQLKEQSGPKLEAWKHLLHFIDTGELSLNTHLAANLLPIACEWKITKCAQMCYDYMMENKKQYPLFYFLETILKYAKGIDLKLSIKELVQYEFSSCLNICLKNRTEQYYINIDRFIQLDDFYNLYLDLERQTYAHFQEIIPSSIENIAILMFCAHAPNLFSIAEQRFCEVVNSKNFRALNDFAIKFKSYKIQKACTEYRSKQKGESLAQIYLLYPLREWI